ncbi:MAG: hypothetical protein LUF04_01425 [Bacteroides sp.]|nr:hypothetical protein [Bacteroides sp.]MCD8079105.1 hypothetical protein [Bacteroides sp.]
MKKLIWMFVAVAAISFASCGGNKTTETPAADADVVVVEEVEVPEVEELNDSIETVEEEVAE